MYVCICVYILYIFHCLSQQVQAYLQSRASTCASLLQGTSFSGWLPPLCIIYQMYQKCTNRECTYVCIPSATMAAFGQSVIDTYTHVTDVYTSVISAHARAGAHLSARTQRCMYMCLQMQVYVYTCMHTPTVRARQAQQARCCASSAKRRAALGRWACSVEQAVVRTRLGVYVYGMCMCMSMGVAMGV